MDAIAHTQVSGLCLVTLVVLLRAQQKMRDKSLPGRQFTALLWFAGALTIVDYGSALAQLGAWEELGIPLTYRLNAGGSILFYLLAACCCLLVFLYVEAELGRTWMEDGRRLALSAAPVTLLLLVLLTARDENGFCYLDAEGLRGSTLFWGAKLAGLAYLAAAFLRCSWTLSHWKQETPKEELKTLLLLALAPAAGFFYSSLDGLEYYGNADVVGTLKAEDIDGFSEIMKEFKPDSGQLAKIEDSYAWYLAATVKQSEAVDISQGDAVMLSIDDVRAYH